MSQGHIAWIQRAYPWIKRPFIINAPMGHLISPKLAADVTKAGGLGFLGAGYDAKAAASRLEETTSLLSGNIKEDGVLPVGMGVLCFAITLDDFVDMVRKYKPVAVWLFAAHKDDEYAQWASRIREVSTTHIWIQVAGVKDALTMARTAKPDVLVMQSCDAGGHGPLNRAGLVSLLPETADALEAAGFGHIPLIAAGGIVDGRGTAAALTLGASGATLGTRFLAAEEIAMPNKAYQKALLASQDGGQSTSNGKIFDEVAAAGVNPWPATYGGRALRNASVVDEEKGVSLEETRKLFKQDGSFKDSMEESRAVAWAGTGVGLVNKVEATTVIVQNTRDEASKILKGFAV